MRRLLKRFKPNWPRDPWVRATLIYWGLIITGVAVRAWMQPGRHNVFAVYRRAGLHWLEGQDLYTNVSEFLYSPLVAAFFVPFAIIPERLAGIIWHVLCGLGFFLIARAAGRAVFSEAAPRVNWSLLALLPLSLGNLNNGQAGLLVITLLLAATLSVAHAQWQLTAACIALATFLKIYPLALGLLLLVFYPRQLSWRIVLWLVGLLLFSFTLQKPAYVLSQYHDWFAFLGADERRLAGPDRKWRDAWLLLRVAGIPISSLAYAALQIAAGFGAAAFCLWGRYKAWTQQRCLAAAFCLATSWMILFGPSTESATYIILAPAVVYGSTAATESDAPGWMRAGMWTAYGLLLLGAVKNAWLSSQNLSIYAYALQPFGALIFVITAVAWLRKDSLWQPKAHSQ